MAEVKVNVPKIIFTKATRDEDGNLGDSSVPVDYIPVWTPNDGVDKGPPILSAPTIDFQMSSPGVSLQVTFLGTNYVLARDTTDPKLYTDATSGLTVGLNQEPLNDASLAEYLEATVSLPSAGIVNSLYACDETAANSSVFVQSPPRVIMAVGALADSQPDTIMLELHKDSVGDSLTLTETDANTLAFTNDTATITARLPANPEPGAPLVVALTSADFALSNTVVRLASYGDGEYRNFAPPIPTSLPPTEVPENSVFYVEVLAGDLGDTVNQPVALMMRTEGGQEQIGAVNLTAAGPDKPNVWRSVEPFDLLSADGDPSLIPGSRSMRHHYYPVKIPGKHG